MFEDLIPEKPNYDKAGCWCCEYTTPHYPNALYCRYYKKYISANDGTDCKMYKERKNNGKYK